MAGWQCNRLAMRGQAFVGMYLMVTNYVFCQTDGPPFGVNHHVRGVQYGVVALFGDHGVLWCRNGICDFDGVAFYRYLVVGHVRL